MGTLDSHKEYYDVHIGVDIGQAMDPTAIVVADPEKRDGEIHYVIRYLKRLPLGIPYPSIVAEIRRIYEAIPEPKNVSTTLYATKLDKQLYIDATGVGKPVADLLKKEIPELDEMRNLHAVFLTGGEAKVNVDLRPPEISIAKAYLVSRLQVLLSCGRVHLPNNAEALAMKEELMNYQIKVNENAHAQFGAFKVGTHDDLVTALGLACLSEERIRLYLA